MKIEWGDKSIEIDDNLVFLAGLGVLLLVFLLGMFILVGYRMSLYPNSLTP